ncbi:xanthine dehydrogenase family protein molybdopterin-binding subunit [Stappia taiwanensis]|uniref:Xanthine dehydrogenase family protein molybdopterin-binding subunit n=1 Tax=Stappia taiwanensis TaxID=992267 RepID=A0A838XNU2_9HYPH|nr:xanthine dehydrogenase family protein molybdopterin-binding subunit [Stappia taiwanensis]MBA4610398.1 xanthine dehydrogenase family protein molybdopterin-binding subunit [Stappia taiwanensis]GGE85295.1 carbon monoxide dehydrogenase [Stappia taiwanensis]
MNEVVPAKFGMGAPVRRQEDAALIVGKGRYVDDIQPEGALHGYVLRSAMAHARISLDGLDAARGAPGVALVLTAAEIGDLGPMPTKALVTQPDGSQNDVPHRPVLAVDTVRHIGEPIAYIVADSVNAAKSAAELIEIDYEPLEAVVETGDALSPGAPLVWPERGSNLAFTVERGDAAATEAAFAAAHKITRIEIVNNRLVANYMEPRGCIAENDAGSERYTLTVGTQGGHGLRDIVAGDILGIDPARLRVVTPDVGGGFGTKAFAYPEYPLSLVAAQRLGRPVKWICERTEHFLADAHGRDNVSVAEVAMDENGRFMAMRFELIAAMGAYLHQYGPSIPFVGSSMATGLYDVSTIHLTLNGVYTNTVPTDAYRGAGRPEAAYLLERLVDKAAREMDLSPAEIRRRNFIAPEQLPYTTATGRMYDTGAFAEHLDLALQAVDWDGFEARRQASAARGRYRGIGLATYVEACAFPGSEEATVELGTDGSLTLLIGTQTNGQGHATAYGQIIAEQFGVDLDRITTVQGDTDRVRRGGGTGGSRSIPIGLPSVLEASRSLVKKVKELAADRLEAGVEDLELIGGNVQVVGTDRAVTLAEIAASAPEPLAAREAVKQAEATYPNGTHICELEVDPDTGETTLLDYVIVDDFGVVVNPLLLTGQVHGGVVQAIGQALMERTVFDTDGQLVTASFLDYRMPRAGDLPDIRFSTHNVPSTTNALGIKGAGEAGTIGACPAVMNALDNALRRGAGVERIDMPATPDRVWEAIRAASA